VNKIKLSLITFITIINTASANEKIVIDGLLPHSIVKDNGHRLELLIDKKDPSNEECFEIAKHHYLMRYRYQIVVNAPVSHSIFGPKKTETVCVANTTYGNGVNPDPRMEVLYPYESLFKKK
jgi:hypothetical protein